MLRKLFRKIRPNPLDAILKRAVRKNQKSFLLCWNRGLGDIALGLYAIVERIRSYIKDAKITFLVRENLKEGFKLLNGIEVIPIPFWRRNVEYDVFKTLEELGIDVAQFDVIIEKPDPNYWVKWQIGKLMPKLTWKKEYDELWEKFPLADEKYIAIHTLLDAEYALWRNWPYERWKELLTLLQHLSLKVIVFGLERKEVFDSSNVVDLRGQTSVLEMLSIIKNKCAFAVLPDSGILSTLYYLDVPFDIRVVSLWRDKKCGIMRQNVSSPNPGLIHKPIINVDVASILPEEAVKNLFSDDELLSLDEKTISFNEKYEPLEKVDSVSPEDIREGKKALKAGKASFVLLAGGMGSRLGSRAKGTLLLPNGKSPFQMFCEKVISKEKEYKRRFDFAVMLSIFNFLETIEFFEKNRFFGLKREQVHFFNQENMPFLNGEGKWVIDNGLLKTGPNGNGSFFKCFYMSCFSDFERRGVEFVNILPIDNPLADPLDEGLIGFHKKNNDEITLISVLKADDNEKLGALAIADGHLRVVEYVDIANLKGFNFVNTGLFCFSIDFIGMAKDFVLPLRRVLKEGLWKQERFIFDILFYSKKAKTLLYDREKIFAPLKNSSDLVQYKT